MLDAGDRASFEMCGVWDAEGSGGLGSQEAGPLGHFIKSQVFMEKCLNWGWKPYVRQGQVLGGLGVPVSGAPLTPRHFTKSQNFVFIKKCLKMGHFVANMSQALQGQILRIWGLGPETKVLGL